MTKDNNHETSNPPTKESTKTDCEQQTLPTTTPSIDPTLIATIHANKDAIETIRGQIVELRFNVDHLRKQMNNRKRSTIVNHTTPTPVSNLPPATSPPPAPAPVLNNTQRVSKSNGNHDNTNAASHSHHHHHHHHVEPASPTGRSSVCNLL